MELMVMRNAYVALAVDTVKRYDQHGILEAVTEEKKRELPVVAQHMTQAFGMTTVEEVFEKMVAIFECANWKVTKTETGLRAVARECKMGAMAKAQGVTSPCMIYCLNPLEAMIKAVAPEATFTVQSTLYEGSCCWVEVTL